MASTDVNCSCTLQMKAYIIYFLSTINSCSPKFTNNYFIYLFIYFVLNTELFHVALHKYFLGNFRDLEAISALATVLEDIGKVLLFASCIPLS